MGTHELKGDRGYQEDRVIALTLRGGERFIGCYDGHCGELCAQYCKDHLHETLQAQPTFGDDATVGEAFRQTFQLVNTNFIAGDAESADPEHGGSGTTAVVVVQRGASLHYAHVGDSRAVRPPPLRALRPYNLRTPYTLRTLHTTCTPCRAPHPVQVLFSGGAAQPPFAGATATALTIDHKPEDDAEQKRITAAGGKRSMVRRPRLGSGTVQSPPPCPPSPSSTRPLRAAPGGAALPRGGAAAPLGLAATSLRLQSRTPLRVQARSPSAA